MSNMSCFPPELLSQSAQSRLNYFLNQTIAHPKLIQTRDKLLAAVRQKAGTPLIFVYGPTGIGKTTLSRKVQQQMIAAGREELGQDPGHIPVAGIELRAPASGLFSWKGCFEDTLQALHEPHIADKIDYDTRFVQPKPDGRLYIRRTANVRDLRTAFESALRQRQLKVFFFDEYFYEHSAGCIGILKDWLSRALEVTLQQGRERLTQACLQETALRSGKLYEVAREIHYGESLLTETEARRQEVRMLLGLVPAKKSRPAIANERPTPPGQRTAKRDPVGVEVEK